MWPCKRKSDEEYTGLGSANWFWPCNFTEDVEIGKKHCKTYHLLLIG
jgi:hypothetical protein